jgi:hypothetical protein
MAHRCARKGEVRVNSAMEWVTQLLERERQVIACPYTTILPSSGWVSWYPRRFEWTAPFHSNTKTSLRNSHHVPEKLYYCNIMGHAINKKITTYLLWCPAGCNDGVLDMTSQLNTSQGRHHRCTNTSCQVAVTTELGMLAPTVCGSWVLNLVHVSWIGIASWALHLWNVCAPMV